MKILTIRVPIHDEHPNFKPPRNAYELLVALSKWCVTKEFFWNYDDGEWQGESVPCDYAAELRARHERKRWEFWK